MKKIMEEWQKYAAKNEERNFFYIKSLKMRDPDRVDREALELHKEAFEKIDCLECGNCCKVSKPSLDKKDVSRIAQYLDLSFEKVVEQYLKEDEEEEGTWHPNALPCPFLGNDNRCQVYEARPGDCQGFPYTDREGFYSRSYQHSANTVVCPAAYYIVERMRDRIR